MKVLYGSLAIAAILIPGWWHAVWTCRYDWQSSVASASARLQRVPKYFGDWDSADLPIREGTLEENDFAGLLARRYQNLLTDEVYDVVVACGRPGPISVHTPDVCFPGGGFRVADLKTSVAITLPNKTEAKFNVATFKNASVTEPKTVRVYWSWSPDGTWRTPSMPRVVFGRYPVLFKLYIIRTLPQNADAPQENDHAFVATLLAHLDPVLFSDD